MMLELNDILGMPRYMEGIGDIYPIRLKEYGEFMVFAQPLQFTKKHYPEDVQEYTLFDLVITDVYRSNLLEGFERLLSLITKKDWVFSGNEDEYLFISSDGILNRNNFDEFRDIVMKQNLLYEDRVFKNPMVKKWADKALEAKSKNGVDMSLEDIVSVVHVFTGVSYEKIAEYTIYQLRHTYERVVKLENHRGAVFLAPYSEDGKIEPFMEKIELYKHPYDDVFVDKSKLDNLNKAIGLNK